ncbi:hypothetical protein QE152_g19597 [Popillia japonica]|uniref:Uncharacterized protein n=1 Tax=Popillia japonica TaxID=7064 RepID=A0AAW1KQS8_POPJA
MKGLNTKRGRLGNQRDEDDWEAFKSTIELTAGNEEHVNYEKGSQLIRQAYKNSIKPRGRRKRVPYWWTASAAAKREECVRCLRFAEGSLPEE